jgi:hypothetical protein
MSGSFLIFVLALHGSGSMARGLIEGAFLGLTIACSLKYSIFGLVLSFAFAVFAVCGALFFTLAY